ncbi:MAG TPA: methylmalonyl Co-A mutase-associated GTPase MeaB [Polyangia bacterium]|nr:methylmalonyl Co-A mutase-associated GTPase MeaB [Polyangia bacterium]
MAADPEAIARAVLAGDQRLSARLMRDLDDARPGAVETMKHVYPHTGRAFVLGVTGNPGAGKSTVVDALIAHYRKAGKRVGVVAVDPTSPFSGGAILGDRIRMQRHATDDGVFIRSLATRGHLGGLSRSTGEVVAVLDAMGYDVVIVETVGVGQDEVDVVSQAETAIVVTVPGLGDEIQAIKAGILEIADVLVVNKSDREGADRTVRDLVSMLELRGHDAVPVEIVRTVATTGKGIDELVAAVERHRERGDRGGTGAGARRRRRAEATLREQVVDRLRRATDAALAARPDLVDQLAARTTDPYTAADELVRAITSKSW